MKLRRRTGAGRLVGDDLTPAEKRLNTMSLDDLRGLLRNVEGVSITSLYRVDEKALRGAARTYMRFGKLTEAAVLNYGKPADA